MMFLGSNAIAPLPMTAAAMAGRASPGMAMTWTPMADAPPLGAYRIAQPEGRRPDRLLAGGGEVAAISAATAPNGWPRPR